MASYIHTNTFPSGDISNHFRARIFKSQTKCSGWCACVILYAEADRYVTYAYISMYVYNVRQKQKHCNEVCGISKKFYCCNETFGYSAQAINGCMRTYSTYMVIILFSLAL